ncbi:MAG TPA: molybdopterin-dependent oxidoreductase [Actinomycetota bacterium]
MEQEGITPLEPSGGRLQQFPPPERWDDWVEYEGSAWPRKVERRYMLVPTVCFNCESACGQLAYVDKETLQIRKLEGNPVHPGSRGRNCAKGPATLNQIQDPERILYPMRRSGARGSGSWERVSWDTVLDEIAAKIRDTLVDGRRNEIVYHVGRPGEDGYADRVLRAWGVDGHNSHTNICSSSARFGYAVWMGHDRPSPDYANARFILLISSHLETGHYFNPHAQRIIEGKLSGAKIAVMDPRLSNTASRADYWMPTRPGSEAAVLLAMAKIILDEQLYDEAFLRRWVNWRETLRALKPGDEITFENFIAALRAHYTAFTPAFAEGEAGVPAATIVAVAHEVARAGSAFSAHNWRAAAAGNLGGWQVARCLFFLNVLTGSVGSVGGTSPNWHDKFVPAPFIAPPPQQQWNELLWPREYPLAHHEMSILLPYFLKEGRAKLSVYFTRVYNPVWTNPDGFTWIEALSDESKVGLHAALTPTWSETAWFADYVLPMGLGPERHDTHSYETHSGKWLGFRQPVLRVAMEKMGKPVRFTYEANPGEVWEEDEFWIELSWRIDPDGSLGIRQWFESPYRPGEKVTIDEYYRYMFEHNVPGLPDKATAEGLAPLDYMRKYGVVEITSKAYDLHEAPVPSEKLDGIQVDPETGAARKPGDPQPGKPLPLIGPHDVVGVEIDGVVREGFLTPSRKLELLSETMREWGWPEQALPGYIGSHIAEADPESGTWILLPTFRLPTLIHTRSNNAKWLNEISHRHPLWIHPSDAERLSVADGDLVKVNTRIGYFVIRAWVTEGIRPGVVAASHHMGRWRLDRGFGADRWSSALVQLEQTDGVWRMRQTEAVKPFESADADSGRVWWTDAGVHQNLTFPTQPDPLSGMHCWHQLVRLERGGPDDRYGDIVVDTNKSFEIYKEWLAMTRPGPGPGGLRRPLWFFRPLKPDARMYQI